MLMRNVNILIPFLGMDEIRKNFIALQLEIKECKKKKKILEV